MILTSWSKLVYTKNGNIHSSCKTSNYFNTIQCITCGNIADEKTVKLKHQ